MNAYKECSKVLQREIREGKIKLPDSGLTDGCNTRQAISYNYNEWKDFFNDRQLLALSWLQNEIAKIPDVSTRDSLFSLFSGTLEFNNLFASYKGEGTGAVRHMFSHHILKPERTPIEANIWGTPKSSGSFSNLFKSRLLRAIEYREAPFEITWNGHIKTINCGKPFSGKVELQWPEKCSLNPDSIYLSCGSSDKTYLPDKCIDYIVTDPPFFDNVNYSELADFFFAWQKLYPRGFIREIPSTRNSKEVQDRNADLFAEKLQLVFKECRRIMKDEGFLVFTYHHSRTDGWISVAKAIHGAGFSIVNVFPVKSEMSVAMPKAKAKEPIQLDVVFVCRKKELDKRPTPNPKEAFFESVENSRKKLNALKKIGLKLSLNDARVILYSQFLSSLGPHKSTEDITDALSSQSFSLDTIAEELTS
jgi:putative DNA methylase